LSRNSVESSVDDRQVNLHRREFSLDPGKLGIDGLSEGMIRSSTVSIVGFVAISPWLAIIPS
jgi:hypothetical protein